MDIQNPKNPTIEQQRAKVEEFRSALVALQSDVGFEPKSTEPLEFLKEKLQSAEDEQHRVALIEDAQQSLAHAEQELHRMELEWEQKCQKCREGMDDIMKVCDRLNDISAILAERLTVVKQKAREVSPDITAVYGSSWYENSVNDFDLGLPFAEYGSSGDRIVIRMKSGSSLERYLRQSVRKN